MSAPDDMFDGRLLEKIRNILQLCSIHRASISFRYRASYTSSPNTEYQRILAWETRGRQSRRTLVSTPSDSIFHIASITKILVGTALVHAIEVKAEESTPNNPWSKFKGIRETSIRDVYNTHKDPSKPAMGFIPGKPTAYGFLVHSSGLPSRNDYILAPDGTALVDLQGLLGCLPSIFHRGENENESDRWTSYSNLNFAVIALMIEACWDGRLDNFMEETLFRPLDMRSTSMGLPPSLTTASIRYTVDQRETCRPVQIPDYTATGAEVAALGAYSTSEDLDKFFSAIIKASYGVDEDTMSGFSATFDQLLRIENSWVDDVLPYTPFGLLTKLSGSTIGSLSTSGLQFPEEPFTTYPAVPGTLGQKYSIHYMAGSAIGCSCATALCVDTMQDFALTVLTDTSGPVAVPEHIIRLILRKYVDLQNPNRIRRFLPSMRTSVKSMVVQAKEHAILNWNEKEEEDQRLRQTAFPEPFDVQGIFNGIGVPHKLDVVKRTDGTLHLAITGINSILGGIAPTYGRTSGYFELLWTDDTHLWLCVPPHISVDRLDNGDWSELLLEVVRGANGDLELKRKKRDGTEDRYIRQT